jgi:hypothetical protein
MKNDTGNKQILLKHSLLDICFPAEFYLNTDYFLQSGFDASAISANLPMIYP